MTLAQLWALIPPDSSRRQKVATGTGSDLIAMAKMGGR